MKILHVLETLSQHYGGPVSVLVALATAQRRAGYEVTIATTNSDFPSGVLREPGWDTLAEGLVPVYYAPVQFVPLKFSWHLAVYLRKTLSEIDILHIHGLYRFPPTYAAWLARKKRIPYIITPHGALDPYLYERSTTGLLHAKRLYERLFDLPNLHNASAIHFTAEEERTRASFLSLRAPSFIVPNGLDWEKYRDLPMPGMLRERWGLGDAPLVLFLGRLHFKKGLDLLVSAFDVIRRRFPEVQLVIVGPQNDDYGKLVRRWVQERDLESSVHFVGPLYGAEVVQAYVDADVFVLPSYTENFGMTVIEAMACALPVVISDQVNIHDEVSAAGAGLVTRCNANELSQAVERLLDDRNLRHVMGAAGRKLVHARYGWTKIVDALAVEYDRLIASHRMLKASRSVRRDIR